MGNRVKKLVKPQTNAVETDEDEWTYTYYFLDASGNTMGVYERTVRDGAGSTYDDAFVLKEHPLYGGSRVGIRNADLTLNAENYAGTVAGDGTITKGTVNTSTQEAYDGDNTQRDAQSKY